MGLEEENVVTSKKIVVLITGCTNNGIGSYLAKHFSLSDCITYASARRLESLSNLKEFGCRALEIDVTSIDSIKKAIDRVYAAEGRIDILINNAGVALCGPMLELDIVKSAQLFDTNFLGVLRVTQAVTPVMIRQGSGTIVNVGSILGNLRTPWYGVYSASKAALHSMTDALRLELRPFNIDVIALKPGAIQSSISRNLFKKQTGTIEKEKTVLSEFTLYKEAEEYIRRRMNVSEGTIQLHRDLIGFNSLNLGESAWDTDTFAKRVVSWILERRNMTSVRLNYFSNPIKIVIGAAAKTIGFIFPQLVPSLSYFSGYMWTLPTELVLGGDSWNYHLAQVLPQLAQDVIVWVTFGLGKLAISLKSNNFNA